jgi:hypothetical protein
MNEILKWRNYDEIQQIKNVIEKIVAAKEKAGEIIDPNEIIAEFKDEQRKAQNRVNKTFPKVKRWANLSTILSIPVAITGLSSGIVPMTIAGATLAGVSKATKEAIDFMNSRYNWLAFINSTDRDSVKKDNFSSNKTDAPDRNNLRGLS